PHSCCQHRAGPRRRCWSARSPGRGNPRSPPLWQTMGWRCLERVLSFPRRRAVAQVRPRHAEALRTAQTMVCLYSPSYFQSENCGKEMQIFLDRRRNYMRANPGQKPPANIIPVVWQRIPRRIPKTLPDIEYRDANHDPNSTGVWDLGDQGQNDQLFHIADQIALRVQVAGDETPLL